MSDDTEIAALTALEQKRGAALVARDQATLESLFPDDLVHIHSTGNVMGRTELLRYVMQTLHFLEVRRSELDVRLHGQVAVMTGKMKTKMQRVDKPEPVEAESWVTQVWVKRGASWVQTNFHAVRAAA